MNKERFISLVKNPSLLKVEDGPFLEELLKEFPYFQSAHLLAARLYKVNDSIHLQKQIKIAAANITDRRVLYNLIENFDVTHQAANSDNNAVAASEKNEFNNTNHVDEVEADVVVISVVEPAHEIPGIPELAATETNLKEGSPEIISAEIASSIDEGTEIKVPFNDHAILSEGPVSTIEAEIPLEREIKLALAATIYAKEFEQNVIETEGQSTEIEELLPKKEQSSSGKVEHPNVDQTAEGTTAFVAWLKKLKDTAHTGAIIEAKTTETQSQKEAEKLVEAFMEKPIMRAKPVKQEFFSPVNMAKLSVTDNDFFVTETLAKIYIKQGNLTKAIKVYQNLSLKNPEKNTFFATQIKILKEQLHNKSGK